MLPSFSRTLTLNEAFETAVQLNSKRSNERNSMKRFAKNSNFYSIDFLHLFAKRRKSVAKMTHQKKNRGHRTSKIVKSTQSCSNDHLPYCCSLYYLERALDASSSSSNPLFIHNWGLKHNACGVVC